MESKLKPIRVGILTISDTRTSSKSNMKTFDSSGHNLKELINHYNLIESARVVEYDCVTDDIELIQTKMIEWCSSEKVDVLLSTGGTGLSSRDVTPEATLGLVQKLTPGISQAIMNESLKITPMAMLSRAVSGVYKKTLIINLPGSKKASDECLRVVACVIPHAVSLIRDEQDISKQFHDQSSSGAINKSNIPECITKIACRHRESPFPKISMQSALSIIKENSFIQYTENNKIVYPTVCIFSTGDELESNGHHCIRDTNSLMIKHILQQDGYGGKVYLGDIARDDWDNLCEHFKKAFNNADIIVTSGGVSMGEKDLIKHVLKEHFKGSIHFGRVDMKPGMPTTFVTLCFNDKIKYVFCLPGNPVSAGVCTHLFILPYLRSISGRKMINNFKAKLTHSIDKLDVRPEYKRALLKYDNGEFIVSCLTDQQQSSRLLSFVGSNCLLQLPSSTKQTKVETNTIMDVILIKSLENTYIAPVLQKCDFIVKEYHKQNIIDNTNFLNPSSNVSIENLLHAMKNDLLISDSSSVCVSDAFGHVLHSKIYSQENLPPFPASIKDGYAIKYVGDSWSKENNIFKVVQVSLAGTAISCLKEINEGECVRISTGAPVPIGTNCIVPIEDTSVASKSPDGQVEMTIAILKEPKLFDNIRPAGSDICLGQLLLDEKTELGPFEIALLKSVGITEINVFKCPTVHIIPFTSSLMVATCVMLKNMVCSDDYMGNVKVYNLCENLVDFQENYLQNELQHNDIFFFCGNDGMFNKCLESLFDVKTHFHVYNNEKKISFKYGVMYLKEKRFIYFHSTSCDKHSFYKTIHLFILPYLRSLGGRKQQISCVKTKNSVTNNFLECKTENAQLHYINDSHFNITFCPLEDSNCLIIPQYSLDDEENTSNTELDVIITENSEFYFF